MKPLFEQRTKKMYFYLVGDYTRVRWQNISNHILGGINRNDNALK